jgi:hypothetical protein
MSWEGEKALESLLFITKKRNGDIKARKVADGSKQRSCGGYDKSDGSSPALVTESIFMTGVVDAHNGRHVAVLDVANAFLRADNNENITMLLRGKLAEMMVRVDPALYREYLTYSAKGNPMLYVRLSKALYGILRAALLFYKRLRNDLELMGFEVNPYDPCVANKIVNGAHMTVFWNVDDLKIPHRDEEVVSTFVIEMAKIFGPKTTISRGDVHDYLGMELDFGSCPGTIIISMIKCLQKIIDKFPEILKDTKACPATENLFKIRDDEDRELLCEEMAKQFHCTTAQLMFLCKRARPDVETLVSFLTTRVKNPDVNDWGKLQHGLIYLKGTLHMKRYLRADNLNNIVWWVDGSFVVHWDSKGHTGAMMSMGKGAMVNISRKHKMDVVSSTESELVSIVDVLGMIL